jgi:hypothetical protein
MKCPTLNSAASVKVSLELCLKGTRRLASVSKSDVALFFKVNAVGVLVVANLGLASPEQCGTLASRSSLRSPGGLRLRI